MPTPSPNQPPDPSPPTSQPFLSCPDDLLHSSLLHSSQVFRQALDTSQNPGGTTIESESLSLNLQSSDVSNRQTHTLSAEDSDLIEEHTSPESLLRSATLSPRLPSNLPSSSPSNHSVREGESSEQYQNCTGHISAGVSSVYRRLTSIISEPECLAEGEHISMMAYDGDSSSLFQSPDFSALRTIPISPSSYLRPGSRFHGTQQSERQVYDVQVEIKHVDMGESFLCGYLRIQGLTEDHPTLTTYFEGEIIGSKYSFFTQHEDWGANAKVDLSHWAKFSAFRPFQKHARKGPVRIKDVSQKENIFMRWKEHFLVPDHRVRTITGASFEGFYYICFNQVKGEVSGIYFHSKSEKFQQLELKHVPDRGRFSAMEFR